MRFLYISILIISFVSTLHAQEPHKYPQKDKNLEEQTQFDTITWSDVNKKNEDRKRNPFVQFWGYLFREREVDSVTGDDLTVIETVTFSEEEDDSQPAPVGVVAIHSEQTQ